MSGDRGSGWDRRRRPEARRRSAARRKVILHDSNPLNPYGGELAAVLATEGFNVTRWCRFGDPFNVDGVRSVRLLRPTRQQSGLVAATVSQVLGAPLFVCASLATRRPIVFTWLHTRSSLYAALALVALRRRVVFVDHNPLDSRALRGRKARLLERLRRSAATRVVHTKRLAEASRTSLKASHPSYKRWVELMDAYRRPFGRADERINVLFLGRIDPDKGSEDLPALVKRLLELNARVRVVGRGDLSGAAWDPVRGHSDLIAVGIQRTVSDDEVADALRSSDVLVAPYQDVTVSGSIIMALSAGLDVVALDSDPLRDLLPADCLSANLDALAIRATRPLLEDDASPIPERVRQLDCDCGKSWRAILEQRGGTRPSLTNEL